LGDLQKIFISGVRTTELMEEEAHLQEQLEERRKQEEILWKQKSRVQWLKEGERNTKFFHRAMIHRRHINRITQLEDSHGHIIKEHARIEEELLGYYQDLLTEPNVDRTEAIQRVTAHIPSLVTPEQNAALTRPISMEEVTPCSQNHASRKSPRTGRLYHGFFPPLLGPDQI
jgi:hypothetical protein